MRLKCDQAPNASENGRGIRVFLGPRYPDPLLRLRVAYLYCTSCDAQDVCSGRGNDDQPGQGVVSLCVQVQACSA